MEVPDQIVTDRVINELMGKDASARFRFIMERADEAEELDVYGYHTDSAADCHPPRTAGAVGAGIFCALLLLHTRTAASRSFLRGRPAG